MTWLTPWRAELSMTAISWADGRADDQDHVDAAHGRVQRVRPAEIARGDLDVAVRRSGEIADQRSGGLVPMSGSVLALAGGYAVSAHGMGARR